MRNLMNNKTKCISFVNALKHVIIESRKNTDITINMIFICSVRFKKKNSELLLIGTDSNIIKHQKNNQKKLDTEIR